MAQAAMLERKLQSCRMRKELWEQRRRQLTQPACNWSWMVEYYINITDGKSIVDIVDEMLYDDNVNTTNSTIKSGVDEWYKHYLLDYSDYLEDIIFCNDRSQSNSSTNGWNLNGGNTSTNMNFYGVSDLSCPNDTDQFSIGNNKAKLDYPVGLMSYREMNLLNNNKALATGQYYWLASPSYFSNGAYGYSVNSNGAISMYGIYNRTGVRPAVSLVPSTLYSDGDGSMESPYVVKMN